MVVSVAVLVVRWLRRRLLWLIGEAVAAAEKEWCESGRRCGGQREGQLKKESGGAVGEGDGGDETELIGSRRRRL